jgi:hypothetical protein
MIAGTAVIGSGVALSACGSSGEPASARSAAVAAKRSVEMSCSERSDPLGGDRIPGATDTTVDGLVLYNLRSLAVQVPARSTDGEARWGPLRLAVGVPSNERMALGVPASERESVGLLFRGMKTRPDDLYRISDLAQEATFEGCPPDTPRLGQPDGPGVGPITGFVGGVVVRSPRCVKLEVRHVGKDAAGTRVVAFPVGGAPCS